MAPQAIENAQFAPGNGMASDAHDHNIWGGAPMAATKTILAWSMAEEGIALSPQARASSSEMAPQDFEKAEFALSRPTRRWAQAPQGKVHWR
jgi:hypothetical protein